MSKSSTEKADFTTQGDTPPVVCQRCFQSLEQGSDLFYMHDNKPDGRGKMVCSGCRQYYLKKTNARQQELVASGHPSAQITLGAQQTASSQNIHKAVAKAQRNGKYLSDVGNQK